MIFTSQSLGWTVMKINLFNKSILATIVILVLIAAFTGNNIEIGPNGIKYEQATKTE